MKRIDPDTRRKLYWLFTPMALVVVWMIVYLWWDVNLLELWFGADIDVLTWCKPALLCAMLIIFTGYAIAAVRQKCWGELTVAAVVIIVMLLNMANVFVNILI